jgi:hypothetical protein
MGGMMKKGTPDAAGTGMKQGFGKSPGVMNNDMNNVGLSAESSSPSFGSPNSFGGAISQNGAVSPKTSSPDSMPPGFGMKKSGGPPPPGGKSSFGFGGMKTSSTPPQQASKGSEQGGQGFGMNASPKGFGNNANMSPAKSSGFGSGASFVSSNSPPMRASEVSSMLSSLANEDPQRMQQQSANFRGPPNRMAMPSPIGELNIESSVRDSGFKPGSDTLLGSLASGSGDQSGSNRRARATGPNFRNGPGNAGVQSGGNTVGGFKPLSVTITDPRTGKKRTISVSSLSETESG